MSALDDLVRYSDTWEAVEELARLRADRKEAAEALREFLSYGGFDLNDGMALRDAFAKEFARAAALIARLEA
jgi:hypothetical protein